MKPSVTSSPTALITITQEEILEIVDTLLSPQAAPNQDERAESAAAAPQQERTSTSLSPSEFETLNARYRFEGEFQTLEGNLLSFLPFALPSENLATTLTRIWQIPDLKDPAKVKELFSAENTLAEGTKTTTFSTMLGWTMDLAKTNPEASIFLLTAALESVNEPGLKELFSAKITLPNRTKTTTFAAILDWTSDLARTNPEAAIALFTVALGRLSEPSLKELFSVEHTLSDRIKRTAFCSMLGWTVNLAQTKPETAKVILTTALGRLGEPGLKELFSLEHTLSGGTKTTDFTIMLSSTLYLARTKPEAAKVILTTALERVSEPSLKELFSAEYTFTDRTKRTTLTTMLDWTRDLVYQDPEAARVLLTAALGRMSEPSLKELFSVEDTFSDGTKRTAFAKILTLTLDLAHNSPEAARVFFTAALGRVSEPSLKELFSAENYFLDETIKTTLTGMLDRAADLARTNPEAAKVILTTALERVSEPSLKELFSTEETFPNGVKRTAFSLMLDRAVYLAKNNPEAARVFLTTALERVSEPSLKELFSAEDTLSFRTNPTVFAATLSRMRDVFPSKNPGHYANFLDLLLTKITDVTLVKLLFAGGIATDEPFHPLNLLKKKEEEVTAAGVRVGQIAVGPALRHLHNMTAFTSIAEIAGDLEKKFPFNVMERISRTIPGANKSASFKAVETLTILIKDGIPFATRDCINLVIDAAIKEAKVAKSEKSTPASAEQGLLDPGERDNNFLLQCTKCLVAAYARIPSSVETGKQFTYRGKDPNGARVKIASAIEQIATAIPEEEKGEFRAMTRTVTESSRDLPTPGTNLFRGAAAAASSVFSATPRTR